MTMNVLRGARAPKDNESSFSWTLPGVICLVKTPCDATERMTRWISLWSEPVPGIGSGAASRTTWLASRHPRGWTVLASDEDWVSDEAGSHDLYWTQKRIIGGDDPIELGKNNSGRGVGGSMIHYAGYTPRFHPSDFETLRRDGVGADWPIAYADLRDHYVQVERELPWRVKTGHGETPLVPVLAPSGERRRVDNLEGGACVRDRDACRTSGHRSTAPSAIAPTASTAATACRAARSMPKRVPT